MKNFYKFGAIALLAIATGLTQFNLLNAHEGRRLEVVVIDNQIFAQGYLSGLNPVDDGGGIVRPYLNSIHGHFEEPLPGTYISTLPGFNLFDYQAFEGHELMLELLGVQKWVSPVVDDTPVLSPLAIGETIGIGFPMQPSIDSDSLGSFDLITSVSATAPSLDIDLSYAINVDPADTLYVLRWQISTDASGILASDSVYTILGPPGVGPTERLHFQSLQLEAELGFTAVPEPSCLMFLFAVGAMAGTRRRRN